MEPFMVRFISDSFETTGAAANMQEATNLDKGFRLQYLQDSTNCR